MAALKYWVWLASLPGLTNRSRLQLLAHFSSPEDVYYADAEEALQAGLSREQAERLADRSMGRCEAILADCAKKELFVLTMDDAAYPARLRNIYDPPVLLYGRGAMPLFDEEAAIAVVGTRRATPYGIHTAEELGYQMAREGALIVSGLAKGIDAAAHRGALRAGGFTAAVLGCGVDVAYPEENRRLYDDIAATGVLLSEYPPGSEPEGWHFPARNRIISGLSVAALVVEAPARSGALITANAALDQGRDVFAVPGPIDAPGSWGCNQLIRSGAGLVSCAWDILGEYAYRFPHRLHRSGETLPDLPAGETAEAVPGEVRPAKEPEVLPVLTSEQFRGLTDDQISILRLLRADCPLLTDEVAEQTEIPVRRVLSALTVLEIDGYARQSGARRFVPTVRLPEEE
ncbi:MAG: DNA-protecting protein DprA [Ruminococcaceae bacterium]|jgi:DNA processing protein|nr:DNA-protecting protein DprA [Oscillospiraceae bacterium]